MSKFKYSAVARESTIICEHTNPGSAVAPLTEEKLNDVLKRSRTGEVKQSHPAGKDTWHFLVDGNIIYIVIAENSVSKPVAAGYLEKLKESFSKSYGRSVATLGAHSLDKAYGRKLKELMKFAEDNPQEMCKVEKIKQQVAETKGVMQANIQKVIDRGEKMEVLAKNSEDMMGSASMFKKKATEVKQAEQWKNLKVMILGFGLLGVLGLVIFLSICGGLRCVGV